jgi:hypothetical protein
MGEHRGGPQKYDSYQYGTHMRGSMGGNIGMGENRHPKYGSYRTYGSFPNHGGYQYGADMQGRRASSPTLPASAQPQNNHKRKIIELSDGEDNVVEVAASTDTNAKKVRTPSSKIEINQEKETD